MTTSLFDSYSEEQLVALLQDSSVKIKDVLNVFSPQRLSLIVQLLQDPAIPHAEEQLTTIIQELKKTSDLEAIGKGLSTEQFLSILNVIVKKESLIDKLSPLLVGLSNQVFFYSLSRLTPLQLNCLKQESALEPLQRQINLLIKECEQIHQRYVLALDALHKEIKAMRSDMLTYELLESINQAALSIQQAEQTLLDTLNQALALTWTSDRLDLIEKLTRQKEIVHAQLNQLTSSSGSQDGQALGLLNNLKEELFQAFGPSDQDSNKEGLQNEDPAIEGLAKLSIWYLKDYREIGLLPSIKNEKDLDLSLKDHSEQERLEYRQRLFNQAQENLRQVGLKTVGDLKRAFICSKKMLQQYIGRHQNRLQT